MKTQNLDIQFFKFIYSCIIVIYHLSSNTAISVKGGYCSVEYFLLVAGLFLFLSFEKGEKTGKQRTPVQYAAKRFARFFPWSITAFLAAVVAERIIVSPVKSLASWMDYFAGDIWEILMIKWNGMNNNAHLLNSPAWTLSAMLIVGFFIWTMMYYYKKPFLNLIMPLTLVIGFGYWTHLPSANTELWIGFTTFGTFRAYLIMCVSFYCLCLTRKLEDITLNKLGKGLLTAVELLIHIFAVLVMMVRAERYYQWLLTLLFMVSISIAISGHSYLAQLLGKAKYVNFLGDLSMSIYLMHVPVIYVCRNVYDISSWTYFELIPLFAVVLVAAVVHYVGTKWLVIGTSRVFQWMKRKVIV